MFREMEQSLNFSSQEKERNFAAYAAVGTRSFDNRKIAVNELLQKLEDY
jgi:hypothetical protein